MKHKAFLDSRISIFATMIYGKLIHPSHPDHVIELRHEERPYWCDGCKEIGFGARYTCTDPFSSCNFHLHKGCTSPSDTLSHPFFPHCVFHFLASPVDNDRYY